jgi:hypothetical protein
MYLGVDITAEVTHEFMATVELLISKHIEEVKLELLKQAVIDLVSYSRFELLVEFGTFYLIEIVLIGFTSVPLDQIIELSAEVLGSAILQFAQPLLYFFLSFIEDVLWRALRANDTLN